MKKILLNLLLCLICISCSKKHYFYTTLYGYDTELSFYDFNGEKMDTLKLMNRKTTFLAILYVLLAIWSSMRFPISNPNIMN